VPFIRDPWRDEDEPPVKPETRWRVHALPGSPVRDALDVGGCELTLSLGSESEPLIQMVEDAARKNGMVIERLAAVTPPLYPATHDD
jgi:hypothetical protein